MTTALEQRQAATVAAALPIGQVVDAPDPLSVLGRLKALVVAVLGSGTIRVRGMVVGKGL